MKKMILIVAVLLQAWTLYANEMELSKGDWRLWLDRDAQWKEDKLFVAPQDLTKLPVNMPTCGWEKLFSKISVSPDQVDKFVRDKSLCLSVAIPGTVEEYCWDALSGGSEGRGTSGDYVGVSWWCTTFRVSQSEKGKRIKLFFEHGARLRAEIYLNQSLVGYNMVGQLPFTVDVTDFVKFGQPNQLAVRITDPAGNFSWGDYIPMKWGKYSILTSHGFGGILGLVKLQFFNDVHVSDIFVKNKPEITEIDADIEYVNEGKTAVSGHLTAEVVEAWPAKENPQSIWSKDLGQFTVQPNQLLAKSLTVSAEKANVWDIRKPFLYNLIITVKDDAGGILDRRTQRFGFRWFEVKGIGEDAQFILNGRRVFILSAISWGFYPVNGMYATKEMAEKHVDAALKIGQNMLNFHRCMGRTDILNLADEKGLLYYAEPGAYSSSYLQAMKENDLSWENFGFPQKMGRHKLLRMVKNFRNHPSLVIYNLVNEPGGDPIESTYADMADAHELDPTRLITYGSGFMETHVSQPVKLHMLPYSTVQSEVGYCDKHNAGNTAGVYLDTFYNDENDFLRNIQNKEELFIWGEDSAVAAPPHLELICERYKKSGRNGWDGADYLRWYCAYTNYIKDKNLEKYYPSVTKLIRSIGDIQYYVQGRIVENVRINNIADMFVLNGYEGEKLDNHSGVVDAFRNHKGRPELISNYMRPAFVAVKARDKIAHLQDTNLVDLHIVNENQIPGGQYQAELSVVCPDKSTKKLFTGQVSVTGGDVFGHPLKTKIPVKLDAGIGYYNLKASLKDDTGRLLADGYDEIFVVDWKSMPLKGKGAVVFDNGNIKRFLSDEKNIEIPEYTDKLSKLDYILLAGRGDSDNFDTIPFYCYRAKDKTTKGLNLDYFRGAEKYEAENRIDQRISTVGIDFDDKTKLIPGYDILGQSDWSLNWEGFLVPEKSGDYVIQTRCDDGFRMWLDDKLVVDRWGMHAEMVDDVEMHLEAGKAYPLKIKFFQGGGGYVVSVKWRRKEKKHIDLEGILKRVKQDGTALLILNDTNEWAQQLQRFDAFPKYKYFKHEKAWMGANYIVREHPFFDQLPVNGGMNWEYQLLVMYDGPKHYGFSRMSGETAIVSGVSDHKHDIGTSVGIVNYGKGKIVFSTLDLIPNLNSTQKAAEVPRKIFCNYLKWAGNQE